MMMVMMMIMRSTFMMRGISGTAGTVVMAASMVAVFVDVFIVIFVIFIMDVHIYI
jgi:thymidylate synthase